MRPSLNSFSLPIALAQVAGWLTVGLLFWLLLLTHGAVAAPSSADVFSRRSSIERLRERRHHEFWRAREAVRGDRLGHRSFADRVLHRSSHVRTERARAAHRQPGQKSSLGPALGSIFQRNPAK